MHRANGDERTIAHKIYFATGTLGTIDGGCLLCRVSLGLWILTKGDGGGGMNVMGIFKIGDCLCKTLCVGKRDSSLKISGGGGVVG